MAQTQNFTWDQGADLEIQLIYKEGTTVEDATAVDLSTGYSVRMDLTDPTTKDRYYTFNSADIPDVDPIETGDQDDNALEGTLTSGAGGTANINITVPRSITLPGGVIYEQMQTGTMVFNYDVFLRNTVTDKQVKVLRGTVTISESYTLWL